MQAERRPYEHRPVYGLPTSLATPRAGTPEVVAMMQAQAGLNRQLRREMQLGVAVHGALSKEIHVAAPKDDRGVLSYNLSAAMRCTAWCAVEFMVEPQGRRERAEWLAICRNTLAHLGVLSGADALDARLHE